MASGLATEACNHTSFRGAGIAASLENGGTLESAPNGGA